MSDPLRLTIELPLLLPFIPDERDQCVERLVSAIKAQAGIEHVHVKNPEAGDPLLCIYYHPDQVSLQRVRELASASGAALAGRFGHLMAEHEPMHAGAARRLGNQLREIEGS